eukprot:11187268-Karenia_brevis.AAC.1
MSGAIDSVKASVGALDARMAQQETTAQQTNNQLNNIQDMLGKLLDQQTRGGGEQPVGTGETPPPS